MLSGMKPFVWFALGFLVFWLLRCWRKPEAGGRAAAERPPERMVRCEHCGVNQPVSKSVKTDGHYFCTDAHRIAAQAARAGVGEE